MKSTIFVVFLLDRHRYWIPAEREKPPWGRGSQRQETEEGNLAAKGEANLPSFAARTAAPFWPYIV
ncbi:MAG: hypothetical protein WB586_09665 [Chthoniobacterales bacterium]